MYTTTLPIEIAKLLESAGMPVDIDADVWNQGMQDEYSMEWTNSTYGEALDWIERQGYYVYVIPARETPTDDYLSYEFRVVKSKEFKVYGSQIRFTWEEAADKGIKTALELIKEDEKCNDTAK